MVSVIEALYVLREKAYSCRQCSLCDSRHTVVFGDIPLSPIKVMLVGEAPGEDEDLKGQPFVGKTGLLLRRMLAEAGLPPESVFVCNCLMCRPPDNRNPSPTELAACWPWLKEKLVLINPETIITVGKYATVSILGVPPLRLKITKLSGKRIVRGNQVIVPLVHPSFVARGGKSEQDYLVDIAKGLYGDKNMCVEEACEWR